MPPTLPTTPAQLPIRSARAGWYSNFQEMYARKDRLLPRDRTRAVLWGEFAAEGMPDWERYRGLAWRNTWINHNRPTGALEEARLGRPLRMLRDSEARLSQAYQGLCFQQVSTFGRVAACDGLNFQLLADGLSRGMYHKGLTDLHRRAKLGYFVARMAYQPTLVTGMDGDFVLADGDALHLVVINDAPERIGRRVTVRVDVKDLDGRIVDTTERSATLDESGSVALGEYRPRFGAPGLYQVGYTVAPAER